MRRHRLAAQAVVGAERDDDDLGLRGEQPVDPGEPAGGGVARHAGVDDPHRPAALSEQLAHERRVGRLLPEPEPRRQAVAEKDHQRTGDRSGSRPQARP